MIRKYIYGFVFIAVLPMTFVGCVADVEANSKSVSDYVDSDVQSYGDLFEVFWSVMNQRYCDLNEQADVSSLDWSQVYGEYKPKFSALKSFLHTNDFTQAEILADNAKAKQYFQEIVGKIIDQHFYVDVTLPVSHASKETVTFASTLRKRDAAYPLFYRYAYVKNHLLQDGTSFDNGALNFFNMIGGYLKEHPDIFYLGFSTFGIRDNCTYTYGQDYLPVYKENPYHLGQQKIMDKVSELKISEEERTKIGQEAVAQLSAIDQYLVSDEVLTVCKKMVGYSNDGDYYGLVEDAQKAHDAAPSLLRNLSKTDDVSDVTNQIIAGLRSDSDCKAICSDASFMGWYAESLAQYLCHERELDAYWTDLTFTCEHPLVEKYRRYFLEPLAEGKINKLILDVRSNGGGDVADTRYLTDYLVSHTAIFRYARKKEDNNPYGYSPWVPQQIVVTPKSLNRDIPTAILIDNHSGSMSESTTLMLKSQGEHVKTIGRNSYGAQCSISDDNSSSNGGWAGYVTSYLRFYMPFVMTKDMNGNVLEVVGITPDYKIDPMTEEELNKMINEPTSAKDRDMEKAIEVLQ